MEEDDTSDKKQHEHRPNEARYHESDIAGATCSHQLGPDMKKRRIQMDSQQCLAHSRTNSGALPLTNPVVIKTSSKDVNRGLHPRQPKQKPRTTQMPSQGDIVHQNASTNDSFPMPKVQPCPRKSVKRNLMKDTNNISDTHNGNVFDKEGTNVAIYASTSTAAKSDSLLDEFEKDTMFDTAEVLNLVEKAESDTSSPCKSVQVGNWGTPFKSLQDEFENDTTFDTTEVLNLVEKAESDTSSPCKKLQGGKWGTPVKSLQDEFETDATFDTAEVLNLVEKAESDTSSPCTSKQGRSWDSPSKSSQDSPAPRDPIVISDDNVDMFSRLPVEVMENIFCNMPILDLSLGVNLVCQSWKDIINRKKYLRWKKRYHKYKVLEETACAEVFSLIVAYQMTCKEAFLLKIIRYVQKFRKWFGSSMVDDLKQHHNYELAKDLFEQRAPELIKDGIPNPWCLIAALAILAETVADVTLIIKCLLNPMATCTALDVTECLYCVATLLLRLQRKHNANRGLHYRVFYALYLYENSFSDVTTTPSKAKKQRDVDQKSLWQCGQNSGGVRLTHEQMRIVTYDPKPNEVIKVIAFAGTGKTTTLVRYAQRRPHMKFLYVAFNRTVKQHAEKVFPSNVTCKTTHSLAYWAVGIRYAESSGKDDKRIQNNLVIHKVNNILPKENPKRKSGLHWITRAKLVIDTLKNFMSSKDEFITTMHVPTTYPKNERSGRVIADLEHHMRMKLADDATLVWGVIINVKCKETISHDVYLKLYQLEKPWLYDYDCLLIDEAQDLTPVQQDILLRQSCAKILVGDPNQQIYSFRGAENAMDQIQRHAGDNIDVKTFHLTQSFRFGPEIAYVSNLLLEFLKKNTTQFIVGTGKQGGIHGDEVGTIAIICRSNVVLFDQAVKICDDARKEKKNTRIGFAGGIKGYQLDMLLDIYRLYANEPKEKIRSKFISMRNSFGDLRSYAFNAMDGELEGKIKIVQKYNIRIPALISEMKRRTTERLEYADIILSTAHKAKGLEFDTVRLTEDFALEAFLLEANGQAEGGIKPDELNLIYVAVTRAKKRLVLNYHLMKFLEYAYETFECPVSTKSVLAQHDEVPHCLECKSLIEAKTNSPLITKRPRLHISFPRPSAEMPPNDGYMCASCSAQGCPWLFELCGQEYASDEEMLLCIGEGYDPNNLEYELVDFEDSDTEEEGAKSKDDREAEEDGGENT